MLCANFIYFDSATYILILTHLNKYVKCSLYYDNLINQIDLIVAEMSCVNHRAETKNTDIDNWPGR